MPRGIFFRSEEYKKKMSLACRGKKLTDEQRLKISQSNFPELRFELSNGRTLCVECHQKTDTYGEKAKKYAAR